MRASSKRNLGRYGVLVTMLMISSCVIADKPDWAGRGKGGDRDEGRGYERERRDHDRERRDYSDERERRGEYRPGSNYPQPVPQRGTGNVQINIGGYFGERQRVEVGNYYREESRGGNCPPGLAKKNNGCLPPGQARRWGVGQPLARDVVYYPVEPAVRVRLGPAPAGHEFIRVASDILLIAVGTGMVVDAIQDLGYR